MFHAPYLTIIKFKSQKGFSISVFGSIFLKSEVWSVKFEVWNLSWVKNAELIEVTGEPHYASLYIDYTADCAECKQQKECMCTVYTSKITANWFELGLFRHKSVLLFT